MEAANDLDLRDEELRRLAKRIASVQRKYRALPYHALAYRVGEVGASRIDQRMLSRGLAELADNRRARNGRVEVEGPWEPKPGVYVSSTLSSRHAVAEAEKVLAKLESFRDALEPADGAVSEFLSTALGASVCLDWVDANPTSVLVETVVTPTPSVVLRIAKTRRNRPTNVLVLHEPGWLYPDDVRLWEFLRRCATERARALVVARAIAPGTFPLMKAVGAMGLQYYSALVRDSEYSRAKVDAEELGWTHVRTADSLSEHPAMDRAVRLIRTATVDEWGAVLQMAATAPQGSGCETLDLLGVLQWWRESGVALPPAVENGWKRWVAWEKYRRRRHLSWTADGIVGEKARAVPARPVDETRLRSAQATQVIPVGLRMTINELNRALEKKGGATKL